MIQLAQQARKWFVVRREGEQLEVISAYKRPLCWDDPSAAITIASAMNKERQPTAKHIYTVMHAEIPI
jgi:hypothetical protein